MTLFDQANPFQGLNDVLQNEELENAITEEVFKIIEETIDDLGTLTANAINTGPLSTFLRLFDLGKVQITIEQPTVKIEFVKE